MAIQVLLYSSGYQVSLTVTRKITESTLNVSWLALTTVVTNSCVHAFAHIHTV